MEHCELYRRHAYHVHGTGLVIAGWHTMGISENGRSGDVHYLRAKRSTVITLDNNVYLADMVGLRAVNGIPTARHVMTSNASPSHTAKSSYLNHQLGGSTVGATARATAEPNHSSSLRSPATVAPSKCRKTVRVRLCRSYHLAFRVSPI
uniref:CN hydrolase domain-containing protein n=1 Tax=Steinernema glaseri TaxID=37863 RepID=A0A1I7Z868_9BILA